jgi:DNA-binding NtrC family response regulator
LELAEQVHKDRPDVELIVTSGEAKLRNSELPDIGTFLSKPYHPSRLIEVMEKKVAKRSGKSDSLGS